MPHKALVTFGVVFGAYFLLLTGSAIGAESVEAMVGAEHHTEKTTKTILTLEEALHRGLENNAQLAAYSSEVMARDFEVDQASFYPNPELSLEMEDFSGSGDFSGTDNAEITATISQKIELGGERRQRVAVGRVNKSISEQTLNEVSVSLSATIKQKFIAILAAQQLLGLAEDQAKLADKVLHIVNERIASGKAPDIERLRFESLLLESELRQEQARQELFAARIALAALWNSVDPDFERVEGDFLKLQEVPEWEALESLIDASPKVSLQKEEIVRSAGILALEKARRIPDLTLDVGAKSFEETGDHAFVAGLSLSVPIFDRNQGAIGSAQAREAKAQSLLNTTRMHMRTALGDLWKRLRVAHFEATMLRDELLPKLRKSFDATSYGYRAGKFGYIDVLDAEQALFVTRDRYVDTLKTFHQTHAELEALLGRSMNEIVVKPQTAAH